MFGKEFCLKSEIFYFLTILFLGDLPEARNNIS